MIERDQSVKGFLESIRVLNDATPNEKDLSALRYIVMQAYAFQQGIDGKDDADVLLSANCDLMVALSKADPAVADLRRTATGDVVSLRELNALCYGDAMQ
ncbi:hypothetical protein [Ruficoccus sp. ZRK36]|uniref:hypothetical protein n=1 Tax=Ruficoccus sp. ZRK36 TaxID=2866311 RepID=UPI001C72ADBC|nr:hypothetical protein [Ruficoccus sp. ZRK36]QYY36498.1 hypothetical protein K0V07_03275 [Ruficoccus sp. ZRK36]